VIVVENVYRRLSEYTGGGDRESLRELVMAAAAEVGRPTFFSMLIIIAAHLPIFTLQRHEGRIFAPMAWTVTSALVGSLIFSLTLVPLLCFWLLPGTGHQEESRVVRACKRVYLPALRWAVERRGLVIAAALVTFAASLALLPALGSEFLPELNEGSIWVNATLPPGISLQGATQYSRQM